MQESILATLSCHSSIRSGQKLYPEEMKSLVDNLENCDNGTSCPHGRPIIWKLKLEEIDSNFYRTY
jgi:DNA mismatch repair protein MutL